MKIEIAAQLNKPILITGESGTGKSVLAKTIHKISKQKKRPFIHVNMAAIKEELFESEIFGHVRGAFTGAVLERKGFCEEALDGILFLDEIGELSLDKQASLLTLLDSHTYYPVGSTVAKTFQGRLICATNMNLLEKVDEGQFRRDLYYRLRFIEFNLKPLRDEIDIEKIVLSVINDTKIKLSCFDKTLHHQVLNLLYLYNWPGNYRELVNTIEYLLCLDKQKIMPDDVPSWIINARTSPESKLGVYREKLANFEKDFLIQNLNKYGGRINETAYRTGINKVTLISKLKKYGIDRRQFKNIQFGTASGI